MIPDFDEFCTWTYVVMSDLYEAHRPRRPGPTAECSDAEMITMAIVGECCGWHQETDLISRWKQHRHLFPHQPDRTRFSRRRRALAFTINLLRQALLHILDVASDPECIIDSLPLPVVQFYHVPRASREWFCHGASFGKCQSKKQTIFGYKLHLLVTLGGVIRDFELAPANEADLTVGAELLREQHDLLVRADKAYISAPIAAELWESCRVRLLTIPRSNQKRPLPAEVRRTFNAVRQIIETVNSQLARQFQIEITHAHSAAGLIARLYTKLTAHTLCVYLNRLLGESQWLQIKHLAFPN